MSLQLHYSTAFKTSTHENKIDMQTITVASKANGGLVLPALLAATYFSQCSPDDAISVECKDVETHGHENAKTILLRTNDGKFIADGFVIKHLVDHIQLPWGVRKSDVCLANLPSCFLTLLILS